MTRVTKEKTLFYLEMVQKRYSEHHITAFCAQMAYFFVLSIFPLIIFIFTIISKLNLDYTEALVALQRFLPVDVSQIISEFIEKSIHVEGSAIISISGIFVLYSASRAVNALQRAVNAAYEVQETRNFFTIKLLGMYYTILFTILIVLTLAIPELATRMFHFLNTFLNIDISPDYIQLFSLFRTIILIALYVLVFSSVYVYLPSKKIRFKEGIPGAIFSVIGTFFANVIFSNFVVRSTNYSIIYGSLSVIIAFMVWLYILGMIIMIGAEINAATLLLKE